LHLLSELGRRLARRDALALKLLEITNEARTIQAQRAEAGRETRRECHPSLPFSPVTAGAGGVASITLRTADPD